MPGLRLLRIKEKFFMISKIFAFAIAAVLMMILMVAGITNGWSIQERVDQTYLTINGKCGGTIISKKHKLVLTAAHCISGDEQQSIRRNFFQNGQHKEQSGQAKVLAKNTDLDLAILQISGDFQIFSQSSILDQHEKTFLGDEVYVIGNPLGLWIATVTKGIISNLWRGTESGLDQGGKETSRRLFQIDAGASGGNSGGPVYDREGHLIGVFVESAVSAQAFFNPIISEYIGFAVHHHTIHHWINEVLPAEMLCGITFHRPETISILTTE